MIRPSTKLFLPGLVLVLVALNGYLNQQFELLPPSVTETTSAEFFRFAFFSIGGSLIALGALFRFLVERGGHGWSSRRYTGIRLTLRG